ncbi:MAG TPA: MarC family protein [Tepidisphaeraceae bacterium]|nr:MarC family protein [Tepidisphaeraceae bacterium]
MFPWLHSLFQAIVPLFVTIDAFGLLPIFIALTGGMSVPQRRRVTFEAVSAATLIALGFMFLGVALFRFLGISVDDFRIAGGILLLVLAVLDLLGPGKPAVDEPYMVGLVPLAMPLIAGPATLTTALVMANTRGYAITTMALAVNFGFLLAVMLGASLVVRVVGAKALSALSKLVMVLLAAIAVNFIRMGITNVIKR